MSRSKKPASAKSKLETSFLATWCLVGREHWDGNDYPMPEREWKFYSQRGWKFDFAWPEQLVAVEIEGGIFNAGRHGRGAGIAEDAIKYNAAAFIGWAVIRLTPPELRQSPIPTLEQIAQLIHRRTVDRPREFPLNSYALRPLSLKRSTTPRRVRAVPNSNATRALPLFSTPDPGNGAKAPW